MITFVCPPPSSSVCRSAFSCLVLHRCWRHSAAYNQHAGECPLGSLYTVITYPHTYIFILIQLFVCGRWVTCSRLTAPPSSPSTMVPLTPLLLCFSSSRWSREAIRVLTIGNCQKKNTWSNDTIQAIHIAWWWHSAIIWVTYCMYCCVGSQESETLTDKAQNVDFVLHQTFNLWFKMQIYFLTLCCNVPLWHTYVFLNLWKTYIYSLELESNLFLLLFRFCMNKESVSARPSFSCPSAASFTWWGPSSWCPENTSRTLCRNTTPTGENIT